MDFAKDSEVKGVQQPLISEGWHLYIICTQAHEPERIAVPADLRSIGDEADRYTLPEKDQDRCRARRIFISMFRAIYNPADEEHVGTCIALHCITLHYIALHRSLDSFPFCTDLELRFRSWKMMVCC